MTAYNKESPETIQAMFNNIATNYDRTNAILSFYMHHLWNAALVRHVVVPCQPKSLVDLCAGTGEIAFRCIKAAPSLQTIHLVDFSAEMLDQARSKAEKKPVASPSLFYLQADVQELPLDSSSVDCVTMAYGIRNVRGTEQCLSEVYRILKTGGSFGILELTEPSHGLLKRSHSLYLKMFLPLLGKWLTSDQEAYQYLCNSIHTFVKPTDLKKKLASAGFSHLRIKKLLGGVATLFIAQKL